MKRSNYVKDIDTLPLKMQQKIHEAEAALNCKVHQGNPAAIPVPILIGRPLHAFGKANMERTATPDTAWFKRVATHGVMGRYEFDYLEKGS